MRFALWVTASPWRIAIWCLTWAIIGGALFATGMWLGTHN